MAGASRHASSGPGARRRRRRARPVRRHTDSAFPPAPSHRPAEVAVAGEDPLVDVPGVLHDRVTLVGEDGFEAGALGWVMMLPRGSRRRRRWHPVPDSTTGHLSPTPIRSRLVRGSGPVSRCPEGQRPNQNSAPRPPWWRRPAPPGGCRSRGRGRSPRVRRRPGASRWTVAKRPAREVSVRASRRRPRAETAFSSVATRGFPVGDSVAMTDWRETPLRSATSRWVTPGRVVPRR